MEATKLLKKDHEKVKELFKQFDAAGDKAHQTKRNLFEQIRGELEVHMNIEETIFYPAVKKVRSEDIKNQVREADEEHHVVKVLIAEISKMQPDQEQYDAKVTVLKENIEHHVEEEEGEMFPDAKKHFSKEKLEDLGQEMETRKAALMPTVGEGR